MTKRPNRLVLMVLFMLILSSITACSSYFIPATTPRPTDPPPADTARIYFVKPGGSLDKAEVFILQRDKVVGYLTNGKVFFVEVPAGEHLFMSVTSNTSCLKANVEGGKTYYVRLVSAPGAMSLMLGSSENFFMVPIEPGSEGWDSRIDWIDKNQLIELNEEKVADWEAKYADRNTERLTKFEAGEFEFKVLEPQHGE